MVKDFVLDGKKVELNFKNADEAIAWAESNLVSGQSNMIVFNDLDTFSTVVQIYDLDCTRIEHEFKFFNLEFATEAEDLEEMRKLSQLPEASYYN